MSEHQNIDVDSVLMRLKDMEAQLKAIPKLTRDIEDLKSLSEIGENVASEVNKEIVDEVEALRMNDIVIPYLQKKADKITFVRRGTGKNARPILESEIIDAQATTNSAMQAAMKLGVSRPTYLKYCKIHNRVKVRDKNAKRENIGPLDPNKGKYSLPKILEGKYPEFPIHRLKDKLIRSGLKKAECQQCGYKERRLTDGKIPLLLNFEDSDKRNHKLENLTVLCYNCTFICGRGYIRKGVAHFNLDPDILQGAVCPPKARF